MTISICSILDDTLTTHDFPEPLTPMTTIAIPVDY